MNRVGRSGLDSSGWGYEPVSGSGVRGNETLVSIKGGSFLAI